jgi:5-methylcytosine-specific restriction endonuclease McrA
LKTPQQKRRAQALKEYKEVTRPFVLKRDGYKCMDCGEQACQTHHILGRVGKLLNDIRFLISQCTRCHERAQKHLDESRPRQAKVLKKKYRYDYEKEFDYLFEE